MTEPGLTTLGASAEEAQQVMEELDVGKTGRISYTEFLAGAREHRGDGMGLGWDAGAWEVPDVPGRWSGFMIVSWDLDDLGSWIEIKPTS